MARNNAAGILLLLSSRHYLRKCKKIDTKEEIMRSEHETGKIPGVVGQNGSEKEITNNRKALLSSQKLLLPYGAFRTFSHSTFDIHTCVPFPFPI